MTDVTVRDLVNSALDEKPLDFEAAMFDVMREKANYALGLKKAEFAKSLFGDPKIDDEDETDDNAEENEDDNEVETDEDQDTEETEEEETDGEDA